MKKDHIFLSVPLRNKEEALKFAAEKLYEQELTHKNYLRSLKKREKQTETYLDNGIAIPHGVREDSHLVKKTGVIVIQCAKPIRWGDNDVSIVAAIAANNDEHLPILRKLTHIVLDGALATSLTKTTSKEDFLRALSDEKEKEPESDPKELLSEYDHVTQQTIPETEALHARPASLFSRLAKRFTSEIAIANGKGRANAKSLPQILRLAAQSGTEIYVGAKGEDAQEAMETIQAFLRNEYDSTSNDATKVDHKTLSESSANEPVFDQRNEVEYEGSMISATSVYDGVTQERIYIVHAARKLKTKKVSSPEKEWSIFEVGLESVKDEIRSLIKDMNSDSSLADIFESHIDILEDEELLAAIKQKIFDKKMGAGVAWEIVMEEQKQTFLAMDDPLFNERAADFDDLLLRVGVKIGTHSAATPMPSKPCILLCKDLLPSQAVHLDRNVTKGLIILSGGATSHAAIIARSKAIPTLIGLHPKDQELIEKYDDALIVFDSLASCLVLDPTEKDKKLATKREKDYLSFVTKARSHAHDSATTKDDVTITVQANLGSVADSTQLETSGAEGVGLFRSEFLFLDRDSAPNIEEQTKIYQTISEVAAPYRVVIRTLDIGGDKMIPYVSLPPEDNPFLGVRGIRLCFRYPNLFDDQLRAIFRANQSGNIDIMFPMISTVDEYLRAKERVETIRVEEGGNACNVGVMIEVPSVLFCLPEMAKEVDFFSIGTNDLIQYLFAAGRGNDAPELAFPDHHPAVLRALFRCVEGAGGKPLSICGAMGGNVQVAPLLVGLGFQKLSMLPSLVSVIKENIRAYSYESCRDLAHNAMNCLRVEEVDQLLYEWKQSQ